VKRAPRTQVTLQIDKSLLRRVGRSIRRRHRGLLHHRLFHHVMMMMVMHGLNVGTVAGRFDCSRLGRRCGFVGECDGGRQEERRTESNGRNNLQHQISPILGLDSDSPRLEALCQNIDEPVVNACSCANEPSRAKLPYLLCPETRRRLAHYAPMEELPPLNIHVIADPDRRGRYRWRIIEEGKSRYSSMLLSITSK
jgi:hypothetical protein